MPGTPSVCQSMSLICFGAVLCLSLQFWIVSMATTRGNPLYQSSHKPPGFGFDDTSRFGVDMRARSSGHARRDGDAGFLFADDDGFAARSHHKVRPRAKPHRLPPKSHNKRPGRANGHDGHDGRVPQQEVAKGPDEVNPNDDLVDVDVDVGDLEEEEKAGLAGEEEEEYQDEEYQDEEEYDGREGEEEGEEDIDVEIELGNEAARKDDADNYDDEPGAITKEDAEFEKVLRGAGQQPRLERQAPRPVEARRSALEQHGVVVRQAVQEKQDSAVVKKSVPKKQPFVPAYPLHFADEQTKTEMCWRRGWHPSGDRHLPWVKGAAAMQGTCPVVAQDRADTSAEEVYKAVQFNDKNRGWHPRDLEPTDADEPMKRQPLQVILMPHTHVDPGWIKTVDGYYRDQTRHILTSVVNSLHAEVYRKFIWAEIVYLQMWWAEQPEDMRSKLRALVTAGRFEIVSGGWVMPDEASSHYYAMVDQLLEGNQWVMETLGVKPISSWSIDPFGHSPTMSYIYQRSGLENMVINRIHYRMKQHLGRNKRLLFEWRQHWEEASNEGILTHVLPYYLYDINYACGPDYHICCSLDWGWHDFKSAKQDKCGEFGKKQYIPGIHKDQVETKAMQLLSQYKKTAQLYNHGVILHPVGGDFRWASRDEVEHQFDNFTKIVQYFHNHPEHNVNVKFGTLSDYFTAVRQRTPGAPAHSITPGAKTFPTYHGDFFSYSDRIDHYWVGFFTSRPFTKRMGRRLQALVREADLRLAMATTLPHPATEVALHKIKQARRELGLFQHHDAITGTSKDFVMADYAKRMWTSIAHMDQVMATLLSGAATEDATTKLLPLVRHADLKQTPLTEVLAVSGGTYRLVLTNSLAYERRQAVELRVDLPTVIVKDSAGRAVRSQLDDVYAYRTATEPRRHAHSLWFEAVVPPLGTAEYTVAAAGAQGGHQEGLASRSTSDTRSGVDIGRKLALSNPHFRLEFDSESGFLAAITAMGEGAPRVDVAVEFRQYHARPLKNGGVSGAYLFLPSGHTSPYQGNGTNLVRVTTGQVTSSVTVVQQHFRHTVRVFHSGAAYAAAPVLDNLIDVGISTMHYPSAQKHAQRKVPAHHARPLQAAAHHEGRDARRGARHDPVAARRQLLAAETNAGQAPAKALEKKAKAKPKPHRVYSFADRELVMRIKTSINSGERFATDLNGFQVMGRTRKLDLGIQGNFYPMSTMMQLQDETQRLTLHSDTPAAVSSLQSGEMEVIMDRVTMKDDNLGLQQNMVDSVPVRVTMKLSLEAAATPSPLTDTAADDMPTVFSHRTNDDLNYPMFSYFSLTTAPAPSPAQLVPSWSPNYHVLAARVMNTYPTHRRVAVLAHHRGTGCRYAAPMTIAAGDAPKSSQTQELTPLWKMLSVVNATQTSLSGLFPVGDGGPALPPTVTANPMEITAYMATSHPR